MEAISAKSFSSFNAAASRSPPRPLPGAFALIQLLYQHTGAAPSAQLECIQSQQK